MGPRWEGAFSLWICFSLFAWFAGAWQTNGYEYDEMHCVGGN